MREVLHAAVEFGWRVDRSMSEVLPRAAFLSSGRAVLVKAKTEAGYVVELGHEDDEGEAYYEGLKVVSKVFDKAPREKIDVTIRELLELERSLRDSVADLRMQKSNMESEHRKRVEYLKQFEQLRLVEDFLVGRLTHFVVKRDYQESATVETREQALTIKDDEYRSYKKELRVLALFGSPDRSLEWKLSHYSDGSGSHSTVYPCTSLEQAQSKAREILTAALAKYKVPERNNCQTGLNLLAASKALGVPLPVGFEEALRQCQIRNHESEVARKAAELATAQAQLKVVRGEELAS